MTQRVSISVDTMNKALSILSRLPYADVAQIIAIIQSDAKDITSSEVPADPPHLRTVQS